MKRYASFLLMAGFAVLAGGARADVLCESFDDPLGGWRDRWLAQNSNMTNYYICSGSTTDENYRGDNPCGLWICDTDSDYENAIVDFDPLFGATVGHLFIAVMPFVDVDLYTYDLHGMQTFHSFLPANGTFPPCPPSQIRCDTPAGLGRLALMSTGQGQVEGNTSVDDICVPTCCPVPVESDTWGGIKARYR